VIKQPWKRGKTLSRAVFFFTVEQRAASPCIHRACPVLVDNRET